jgi:hypothetical protein
LAGRAGAGSWRDFFTGNPLGGSLVEEVGTKGEKAGHIRESHHAAGSELARRPPSPAARAPTGAHSSASIPCSSARLPVLDKLCSLLHRSFAICYDYLCISSASQLCLCLVLQFVFDYLCTAICYDYLCISTVLMSSIAICV